MDALGAYSDSDDDVLSPPKRPRKSEDSTQNVSRVRRQSENPEPPGNIDDSKLQSSSYSPSLQSFSRDDRSQSGSASPRAARVSPTNIRNSSNWSPDPNDVGLEEEALLREPPPPARHGQMSPSPGGSRLNTPATGTKLDMPAPAFGRMPTNSSIMSLVNYGGAGGDDENSDVDNDNDNMDVDLPQTVDKDSAQVLRSPKIQPKQTEQDSPEVKIKESKEDEKQKELDRIDAELLHEAFNLAGDSSPANTPQSQTGSDDSPLHKQTDEGDATQADQEVRVPPEPAMPCKQELLDQFAAHFHRKHSRRYDFNAAIQNRKDFRNPSMYAKLIELFNLDELGTNFDKSVFDPHGYKPCDYYEKLGEAQKLLMDRQNARGGQQQSGVTAVSSSGVSKDSVTKTSAAPPSDLLEKKARRSKWDGAKA